MQVFRLRQRLIGDYGTYVRSFIEIRDERIRARVREELDAGLLWPQPLIKLNPSFESGGSIEDLVDALRTGQVRNRATALSPLTDLLTKVLAEAAVERLSGRVFATRELARL